MLEDAIDIITGPQVEELLRGQEEAIVYVVRSAYLEHARGHSSLPPSSFVRFREGSPDRIIALPGYLGGSAGVAGIKWISSVPSNHERGLDRASAVIALNDVTTGRVTALLEGSIVSAKRTAAGAALGARCLVTGPVSEAGLIGLGLINFEILRFLRVVFPSLERLHVYDKNPERIELFRHRCAEAFPTLAVESRASADETLRATKLTSLATTAVVPHIDTLDGCDKESVILHVSLRDFHPDVILGANNVVDDVDHVCRANTSVHLAVEKVGRRDFLVPLGSALTAPRADWAQPNRPSILSPFGLGVLDLAVASFTSERARSSGVGTKVESFHPPYWALR
jgi:ornithine cyclodeaminase